MKMKFWIITPTFGGLFSKKFDMRSLYRYYDSVKLYRVPFIKSLVFEILENVSGIKMPTIGGMLF